MKQIKKPEFLIGAGKGGLMPILNEYLSELNFEVPKNSRKLVHEFETEEYKLKVAMLRWDEIKANYRAFDLVTFGADKWLEDGHKAMIALRYFNQDCKLCHLVPEENQTMSREQILNLGRVATSYPALARAYLEISQEKIKYMSGSIEVAHQLGWCTSAVDVVQSGKTANANGLIVKDEFMDLNAVLATCKPERIPLLEKYGLIRPLEKSISIAFDGNDGSGKSLLTKFLVNNGIFRNLPSVQISPYSGDIGREADSLRKEGLFLEWASAVGMNHWRAPQGVSAVYDRSVLTCLTELIKNCESEDNIKKAIELWEPLPDIIFYTSTNPQTLVKRISYRGEFEEFDTIEDLNAYDNLYRKAVDAYKKISGREVIEIDTNSSFDSTIKKVKIELDKRGLI